MTRKTGEQVLRDHSRPAENGCILWTGAQNKGYGKLWRDGKTWGAHRFAWTLKNGPIPDGMVIDHLCRTPLCINPEHMEATSIQVNTLRGISSSAFNAVKAHCKRGHEFTPENTYLKASGRSDRPSRHCRTCKPLYLRAYRAGMNLDEYLASQEAAA